MRAGIVGHPVDYPWSSYRERMGLAAPAVLDADPVTVRAGESADDRRRRYTAYFATSADHAEDELIRRSVNRNQLTGGDVFIRDIQLRTGLWIESRGRGRPARGNEK